MTRRPKLPRHLVATASVIVGSLIGLSQSARADATVDSVPARYIVEFRPGAVPVTVKADDPRAPEIARDAVADAIADDVIADGGALVYDYDTLPFVAIESDDASEVWAMPGVVNVTPEIMVTRTLDTSLDVIDAADGDLSAAIGGQVANGSGTAVAIIDDGIDRTHPSFMLNGVSRVVAEACFVVASTDPDYPRSCPNGSSSGTGAGAAAHHPGDYHGTHVAGIAAGNSQGTSVFERGVAGSADIVAVQVFDQEGGASSIDIDHALSWVYDQVDVHNRDIASVNMSLGGSTIYTSTCGSSSSTKRLVDDLASVGVTVFVAAGNAGSKIGVSWPACLPNVVPVGSSADLDAISSFSNIGPQVRDLGVVAPGSGICAAVPTSVLSDGYGCLSGTSMASPHAAGLAALVKQAKPSASVAEVKAAVRTTSTSLADTRAGGTISGLRRINAWQAMGGVLPDQGEITGTITDVTAGGSVAVASTQVAVSLSANDQVSGPGSVLSVVATSPSGVYRLRVPQGTWSSEFSAPPLDPSSTVSSVVVAGGTATRNVTLTSDPGTISGTIDQSPTVFSAAEFRLEPTGNNSHQSMTISVSPLAENGAFSLTGVRAGTWTLTVVSDWYSSDPISLTVQALADSTLGIITLAPQLGDIAGTVSDSLSLATLSGSVTITGTPVGVIDSRVRFTSTVSLGGGGSFTLNGVRAGDWSLVVSHPDYATGEASSVSVITGQTANLQVALEPRPGVVTGSVSDPLATANFSAQDLVVDDNIQVTLTPAVPSAERSTMILSQSLAATGGSFSITNVVPGDWTLTGSVFGYQPLPSTPVVVSPNGTADLGTFDLIRRTALASSSPASGTTAGGTTVTIRGKHLTGATAVSFGAVAANPATINVVSDTELTVTSPAASAGTVTITVTTSLGTSTDLVPFSFVTPAPAPAPAPVVGGGGGGGGGGTPSPTTKPVTVAPDGSARVDASLSFGTVKLVLAGVSGSGDVTVTPKAGKPTYDSGGMIIPGYWLEITSTVSSFGVAEVCAPIETTNLGAYNLTVSDMRLFHWENNVRRYITTSVDTVNKRVCGEATSFSPFAVGALQTRRTAGADRYETAAKASSSNFSSGVGVAYVTTGEKFPDALAAGAAAGKNAGPVLLTRFGSVPSHTKTELQRLKPKKVVVVGGPAVIDESVLVELRSITGVTVERVWGADRFETSAKLSAATFTGTGGAVYIGSGLGFTEVLAAAAAAGRDKAPLLLVPGTGPNAGVPLSVAVELARLAPSKVTIVGGASLIGQTVVDQVKALLPRASVTQVGGVDAYETAAKIARTFTSGGTVYVATGAVFADGLAGGAVAAVKGGAMVMVPPDGDLQSTVKAALVALAPRQIVVLGGPAAISYAVENAVAKYLPS
jgi:putative cell wall-binding protein/subtilisin family serine protease